MKRREKSIAQRALESDIWDLIIAERICPHCLKYRARSGDDRYHCDVLGENREPDGISFPVTSKTPCTIGQALHCRLTKLPSKGG